MTRRLTGQITWASVAGLSLLAIWLNADRRKDNEISWHVSNAPSVVFWPGMLALVALVGHWIEKRYRKRK